MEKISQNKIIVKNFDDFLKLSPQQIKNLDYKNLAKGLKYLRTDIKYDLRKKLAPQSKAKLNKIRDIYISTLHVPNPYIFTPRKNHLKSTAEYTNLSTKWKRYVINKKPEEEIYFKNGKMRLKSKYIDSGRINFDLFELINDTEKEINRVTENIDYDTVKLICGDSYIGGHANYKNYNGGKKRKTARAELLQDVNKLMNIYDNPEDNGYFGNWLFGIETIKLKNQNKSKKTKKKILSQKRVKNNGKKKLGNRRL